MQKKLSISVIGFGILLHGYSFAFNYKGKWDSFFFEILLLSMLPYLICTVILFVKKKTWMPFTGAAVPLLADLFTYYSVFIKPEVSTASLALFWVPVWNLILLLPIGLLIGHGIDKSKKPKLDTILKH
jgi:hypothetical protein